MGLSILTPGPTRLMGIVNVTPDSFSSPDARSVEQAIELGLQLADEGADIIDVGGESTRPGAARVETSEELRRVIPVVAALADVGLVVSVDTMKARVARAAVDHGAQLINDVSGGLADPAMLSTVASTRAAFILQHWHTPLDHEPTHHCVVREVVDELTKRAQQAMDAGINPSRLVLDPGVGFGKSNAQNWELVAHAEAINSLGYPVLWGVSRKRFLADAYRVRTGLESDEPRESGLGALGEVRPTEPWQRDTAGVALTAILARAGAWAIRVHTASDHRVALDAAALIGIGMNNGDCGGVATGELEASCSRPVIGGTAEA